MCIIYYPDTAETVGILYANICFTFVIWKIKIAFLTFAKMSTYVITINVHLDLARFFFFPFMS